MSKTRIQQTMPESRQLRRSLLSLLPPLAGSTSRERNHPTKKTTVKRRDSSSASKSIATKSTATSRSLSPAPEDADIQEIHEITSIGRTCGPECRSCSFFDLSSTSSEASSLIDSDISSAVPSSRSSASYSYPAWATSVPLTPVDSRNTPSPTRRGKKDSMVGSVLHYDAAPPLPPQRLRHEDASLASLDRFTFSTVQDSCSSGSSAATPRPALMRSEICYFSRAEEAAMGGDWPLQSHFLPADYAAAPREFARPTRRHTDGLRATRGPADLPEERDFRPPMRRHTDGPMASAAALPVISHPHALSRARSPAFAPSRPAPAPPLAFLAAPPPELPLPSPRKKSLRPQRSFSIFQTPPLPTAGATEDLLRPRGGEDLPEPTEDVASHHPTLKKKMSMGFKKLASRKSFSRLRGGE